jgi:hypothetical protein
LLGVSYKTCQLKTKLQKEVQFFSQKAKLREARITDSEQKLVITILVEENRKNKLMLEEQRELNILLVNENVNLKWDRSVEHYRRPAVVTHSPRH